jgi:predicted dehydrogenase
VTAPVGVAILGCAHTPHAWSYARALVELPQAQLLGLYDPSQQQAESLIRDFGAPYYSDAVELVELAAVDAVVVCSETADHHRLVEMAAARGRHVLCEKPLATTLADACAMVSACAAAGVQLHTAFVSRFHPLVVQARATVRAGDLGDLVAMVGGNRGRPPLPPHYPKWITDPSRSGGGALIDHSVHLTDVMRHVSGQEVGRLSAEADALLWGRAVDDVAVMSLVFDGGAVATIDPSWSVPANNPWDYDFFLRLLGTGGSLTIDDVAGSLRLVGNGAPGLRLVPVGTDIDALLIAAFVASVQAGDVLEPCASGEDGLRALEVALAGYASAERGAAVVRLPLLSADPADSP